jgi:hypothetical protein
MTEERSTHSEEQEKKPRPWRPTNRQALWAIGLVIALVTITLLVANLYSDIWQALARERVAMLIGLGVTLVAVIVLLAIGGASLGWTGFADKTLWEWLQLLGALAIPIVLAIAGFWFTTQQEARQQRIEAQRAQQAQKIEDQRAEAERQLGEQRAQDEALQAYLDQMSGLLLADKGLRESEKGSEVRTLARARTITVLGRLDGDRKSSVVAFLIEAGLIQKPGEGRAPIISLRGADLSGVVLSSVVLSDANLSGADLFEADLSGAVLSFANLNGADLRLADLSGAVLHNTDLSGAYLDGADLSNADLSNASGVTQEMLEQQYATLKATTLPDETIYPGRYAPREFEPAVSFKLGEGWEFAADAETPGIVSIITRPEGGLNQLFFTHPRKVYDPTKPSEAEELPAPQNAKEWVSWFQRHPNLDTSKPGPVSVGGASGKHIDVTITSAPENYPQDLCGDSTVFVEPCVPLYPLSDGHPLRSYEGWRDRFFILDVGGELVIIDVGAPTDKFEEFLPKAQKVLDSVEWKGG